MELGNEQKLEQLEKVLQSRALQNSESLKAFLRFVVEKTLANEERQLKEYTIATDVFGRNSDYDPRIDSVVRVQAGRLRTKLLEYYATEGKGDQIIIDLPKGHYHPVFSYVYPNPIPEITPAPPSLEPTASETAPPTTLNTPPGLAHAPSSRGSRIWRWVPGVMIVILMLAVLALLFSNRELRRQAMQRPSVIEASEITEAREIKAVWGPFLSDPEPPLLVLSNPAVYRFVNKSDPQALTRQAIPLTPEQTQAMPNTPEFQGQYRMGEGQQPKLIPSLGMYTGIGEAIGLYRLADLFRIANKSIMLKQSRLVSAADLKYRNVILLGSIYVNEWSGKLLAGEKFTYTTGATIENHLPEAGEEREYQPQFDELTGELLVDYALITVKPNTSGEHVVMTLAGIYSEGTEAATEFVTTRQHLAVLAQRLQHAGGPHAPPKYYQALIKVEVENGTPTTITLLSLHPLRESGR